MGGALGPIDFLTQTDPPAVVEDQQPVNIKFLDGLYEIGDDLAFLWVAETTVTVVDIGRQDLGQVVVRRVRVPNLYGAVTPPKKRAEDSHSRSQNAIFMRRQLTYGALVPRPPGLVIPVSHP